MRVDTKRLHVSSRYIYVLSRTRPYKQKMYTNSFQNVNKVQSHTSIFFTSFRSSHIYVQSDLRVSLKMLPFMAFEHQSIFKSMNI